MTPVLQYVLTKDHRTLFCATSLFGLTMHSFSSKDYEQHFSNFKKALNEYALVS
jgi:hypothetical protein